jgi:glycosyltransferase involved in cell wall biosynthesis
VPGARKGEPYTSRIPIVSVIVPTHNRRGLLAQAIASVARQTIEDIEIIVVDDGSDDDTPAFLGGLDEPRLRVLRKDRAGGVVRARNDGIAVAGAPWLAFLDDDDLWAPTKLEHQLAAVRATAAGWSCVSTIYVDAGLSVTEVRRVLPADEYPVRLRRANVVPGGGSGVLVSSDLMREVEGFREDVEAAEDWECWIRLSERARIAPVDRPLLAYRRSFGNRSYAVDRHERAYHHIRLLHPADDDPTAASLELQMRFLARQELSMGNRAGAVRRLGGAVRMGRLASLPHALAMLAAPAALLRWRARHQVPSAWRREAADWLASYE